MDLQELFNDKNHKKKIEDTFAMYPFYFFRMVRFRDLSHKTPKYRWHLVFRTEDSSWCIISSFQTSPSLFFSMYYDDEAAGMSVLQIKPHEYGLPFSELTYLDCNLKSEKNKREFRALKNDIDWNKGIETKDDISLEFAQLVAQTIVKSPLTERQIKEGFIHARPELFTTNVLPQVHEKY